MSRSKGNGNGNVFKLSGNLALGANDYNNDYSNANRNDYSNANRQYPKQEPTLNYQKSYNQVNNKPNQYIYMKYGNINNKNYDNYDGGSYSNQGKRNQNNNPSNRDYQYNGTSSHSNARSYGVENVYSDPYQNSQNRISNSGQRPSQYPPQQQQKYDYKYNDIGPKPQKKTSVKPSINTNRRQDYQYQYSQGLKSKSNINSYNKEVQQQRSYQYQQKYQAQSKVPSYGNSNSREGQTYSKKSIQNVTKKTTSTINKNNNNRDYDYQPEYKNKNSKVENQRGLKEKENVQIKEYDPSTFKQCRAGCGRKFNPDSIAKHQKICKKVFQKKRKQFNVQEQRIVSKDQVKLMKQGQIIEKKLEQKKANEKLPKWKAESLAFRAVLKSNNSGNKMTAEQKKLLDQSAKVGLIQCKFCGRSFSELASKRHIPFCQLQQKKNAIKKRK